MAGKKPSKTELMKAARTPREPPPDAPPEEKGQWVSAGRAPLERLAAAPAPPASPQPQPTSAPAGQEAGAAALGRGVVVRGGVPKRRITAYLEHDLGQRAVMEAARRGVDISDLVAEALRQILAKG